MFGSNLGALRGPGLGSPQMGSGLAQAGLMAGSPGPVASSGALTASSAARSPIVPYDTPSGLAAFARGGTATASGHTRGPGDGTADQIPAMLSDGEFVVPADVVSHLGNGSNDAGAKKLDGMLSAIRGHKATGKKFPPKAKPPLSYIKGHGVKKAQGGALKVRTGYVDRPDNTESTGAANNAALVGVRGKEGGAVDFASIGR